MDGQAACCERSRTGEEPNAVALLSEESNKDACFT